MSAPAPGRVIVPARTVACLALIALVTAYVMWVQLPLEEDLIRTRTSREHLFARLATVQIAAAHRPELIQEQRRVGERMSELAQALPNEPQGEALSSRVGGLAKHAGMVVDHLEGGGVERRRKEIGLDFYDVIPLRVEMHGEWPAIADFGARLIREPRLIRATRWSVGDAGGTCHAVVLLEAYAFRIPIGRKWDYIGN